MTRVSAVAPPRMDVTLLITLLVHVSRETDHCSAFDDVLLELTLRAIALRLNSFYHQAGAPYGDNEEGFRAWLYERWPAPPRL